MKDANKLLAWKNYAETRRFAIVTHRNITKKNHLKWLENRLKKDDNFFIIHGDGRDHGDIRLEEGDNEVEISIRLDKGSRGRGIALTAILEISALAKRLFPKKPVIAKIVNGNIASMKTFCRAGYVPFAYNRNHGYYILKQD